MTSTIDLDIWHADWREPETRIAPLYSDRWRFWAVLAGAVFALVTK